MPVPAGTRFPPVTGTPAGKRTYPASGAGVTRALTACARPRSASSACSAWARARGVPARPGRPSVASRPPPIFPAVGASVAIVGLFGAWFVVSRRLHLAARGIVVLIAINLALSFFFRNAIAWQDHIGGLLTGALLTAAYAYAPPRHRAA